MCLAPYTKKKISNERTNEKKTSNSFNVAPYVSPYLCLSFVNIISSHMFQLEYSVRITIFFFVSSRITVCVCVCVIDVRIGSNIWKKNLFKNFVTPLSYTIFFWNFSLSFWKKIRLRFFILISNFSITIYWYRWLNHSLFKRFFFQLSMSTIIGNQLRSGFYSICRFVVLKRILILLFVAKKFSNKTCQKIFLFLIFIRLIFDWLKFDFFSIKTLVFFKYLIEW